jgi:hypothetical protein
MPHQLAPGVAAEGDDAVAVDQGTVRKLVGTRELPDVLGWIEYERTRR